MRKASRLARGGGRTGGERVGPHAAPSQLNYEAAAARQSREPDRVEPTIDIADYYPDLIKFQVDGQACHRRTPFLADQLGAISRILAPALPGEYEQEGDLASSASSVARNGP